MQSTKKLVEQNISNSEKQKRIGNLAFAYM